MGHKGSPLTSDIRVMGCTVTPGQRNLTGRPLTPPRPPPKPKFYLFTYYFITLFYFIYNCILFWSLLMVLGFNSTRTFDSSTEMGWVLTHRDPDLASFGPHTLCPATAACITWATRGVGGKSSWGSINKSPKTEVE